MFCRKRVTVAVDPPVVRPAQQPSCHHHQHRHHRVATLTVHTTHQVALPAIQHLHLQADRTRLAFLRPLHPSLVVALLV